MTATGAKRSLAMLAKVGPVAAIAAIDGAMTNGYQGLWPKKAPGEKAPVDPSQPQKIGDSGYYRCHCGWQAPLDKHAAHRAAEHKDEKP